MTNTGIEHNQNEVLTLDGIEAQAFHCDYCGRINQLYILSGKDTFKCQTCDKKSSMNKPAVKVERNNFEWAMVGAQSIGRTQRALSDFNRGGLIIPENPLARVSDRDLRSVPEIEKTYTIRINNVGNAQVPVTIFGANRFLTDVNYGLPATVSVSAGYRQMLIDSMRSPFVISGFRIESSTEAQLHKPITITSFNADGDRTSMLIRVGDYITAFQFIQTMVDVFPFEIGMAGNVQASFDFLGDTTVDILFYVSRRFSPAISSPVSGVIDNNGNFTMLSSGKWNILE